jgi:hypothetical protein
VKARLEFECAEGHRFRSICDNVQRGSWCPVCSRPKKGKHRRLSLVDMESLAAQYGGRCLSPTYGGSSIPLLWECSQGHTFWKVRSFASWSSSFPPCSSNFLIYASDPEQFAPT